MQMQLRGQYVVLNCMSHFHGLIRILLEDGGVGFVQQPHIICLDQQVRHQPTGRIHLKPVITYKPLLH